MKAMSFVVLSMSSLSIGCATIVGGTDQMFSVTSNVQGASVYYNGAKVGQTPFTGKIRKKKEPTIMIEAEGYQPHQAVLSTTTPTIFWGNIILGGTLGSSTDYASGAMFEVTPATYYANLMPLKDGSAVEQGKSGSSYDFGKDTEIKKFAMTNYEKLRSEIVRGSGDNLNALLANYFDEAGIPRKQALAGLKELVRKSPSAIEFGEGVAAMYFKAKSQ